MISLAIANFNRHDMVIESFIQVMNNDLIDEIIILDDYSDIVEYTKLWNFIAQLNTNKVHLYRNAENVGSFFNKYKVVKRCCSDWVILLDSDNIIDNDYVNRVGQLEKDENIIYCPEVLYKLNKEGINWDYIDFVGKTINKKNIKQYMGFSQFSAWINTGNFFFNRKKYISVVEKNVTDKNLCLLDSVYFNYLWLKNGGELQTLAGLSYIHRIHAGSYYIKNRKKFEGIAKILNTKISQL
jgi:choline kinase